MSDIERDVETGEVGDNASASGVSTPETVEMTSDHYEKMEEAIKVEVGDSASASASGVSTPETVEMTSDYYEKMEAAIKVENLNVLGAEGDSKVLEKKIDVEAPRPDDKVKSQIDSDIARVAARAVFAAASLVSGDTPKRSNLERAAESSELAERSRVAGGESSSEAPVSSTPRDSITECQLAARIARTASDNAKESAMACRRLMGLIDEAIDVIQIQVEDFVEKAENDETGNYMALVEKHRFSIETLRRQVRKLGAAASSAEEAAIAADRSAAFAEGVTDEELPESSRIKFGACFAKNNADATCIVAHKVEHSALRSMKRIWTAIRDGGNEGDSDDGSNNELGEQCQNRDRKTRIAHVAASVTAIAFLSALSLFEPGSDSFYAILCLGVLTAGWSLLYWTYEAYEYLKSRNQQQASVVISEARVGFLDHLEERLKYLQEYLARNNTSPAPSDSESESED